MDSYSKKIDVSKKRKNDLLNVTLKIDTNTVTNEGSKISDVLKENSDDMKTSRMRANSELNLDELFPESLEMAHLDNGYTQKSFQQVGHIKEEIEDNCDFTSVENTLSTDIDSNRKSPTLCSVSQSLSSTPSIVVSENNGYITNLNGGPLGIYSPVGNYNFSSGNQLDGSLKLNQSIDINFEGRRIGAYTKEERKQRIERFRMKKLNRIWKKQIKYDCRKRLADTRPRIKGRFVSRSSNDNDDSMSTNDMASMRSIAISHPEDKATEDYHSSVHGIFSNNNINHINRAMNSSAILSSNKSIDSRSNIFGGIGILGNSSVGNSYLNIPMTNNYLLKYGSNDYLRKSGTIHSNFSKPIDGSLTDLAKHFNSKFHSRKVVGSKSDN